MERTVFTASGVLAGLFPAEAAAGELESATHGSRHPLQHTAAPIPCTPLPTAPYALRRSATPCTALQRPAATGTMAAEVALNVPRGGGDAEEFMVINVQRCPRLKALFKQGQRLSTRHLDAPQV